MKPILLFLAGFAGLAAAVAGLFLGDSSGNAAARHARTAGPLPPVFAPTAASLDPLREAEGDPAVADRLLAELRHSLAGEDRPQTVARLRQLLAEKSEGRTSQAWQWDEVENRPVGIPGLRASLLALLGSVSPTDAAPFALAMLVSPQATPEDWTVAFHALLRDNSGSQHTAYLRELAARMLQREDWFTDPSPGLLQALPLMAVYGGREEFINFTELCGRNYGEGVDGAAEAAATSIALEQPELAAAALTAEPGLLAAAPHVRQRLAAAIAEATNGGQGAFFTK